MTTRVIVYVQEVFKQHILLQKQLIMMLTCQGEYYIPDVPSWHNKAANFSLKGLVSWHNKFSFTYLLRSHYKILYLGKSLVLLSLSLYDFEVI